MDLSVEPRKRSMPEHPADIVSLSAELSEDRCRVRTMVKLDRADTSPDLDFFLLEKNGEEICHSTIIEIPTADICFTLHIRKDDVEFPVTLKCLLSYLDNEVQAQKGINIQ
jgi:hypothetical protein